LCVVRGSLHSHFSVDGRATGLMIVNDNDTMVAIEMELKAPK
jgi:hypothetical protein